MANFTGVTTARDSRFLVALGHLKPDANLTQARAEANTIASQWASAYPKENAGRSVKLDLYQEFIVGNARPMLWLLFLAAGAILLIACANLANLLLARGLARQREMAVRAALGASRWRLVRQLLTETTVLGLAGGVAGVLLAHWALWGLLKLPQNFVRAQDAAIDTRILLFAFAISVITGWLFGLVPALHVARTELNTGLKEGGRGGGSARWNRTRSGFVVAQVAFSILLLIAAGLLIRSFDKLLQSEVGFESKNLLTLEYRLPRAKYTQPDATWNFHRQVLERVEQLPGIKSAALIRGLPFSGNGGTTGIALLDRETPLAGREPQVSFNVATGGYFGTAQIPLIRGRLFGDQDRAGTPIVFIINQTMARRFWPEQDPIGKRVKLLEDGTTGPIIGIVGDTKQYRLNDEPAPQLYAAYSQQPIFFATLVARTTVEPLSVSESVRQAIWRVDPDQPMWKIRSQQFLVERSFADRKFLLALMIVFAALALVLTVIGLYGVISYLVNQRTQEIGIRMALGAQMRHILQLILKHGVMLVSLGVIIGLAAAAVLTRLMAHMLYGVSATDPVTFTAIGFLLTLVALGACYLPARRAAQVDPVIALRSE
jgi:putative ABC transport system permease protein